MKTKARKDSIRKRRKIEEKYSWDRMNDAEEERKSHSNRAIIATLVVIGIFFTYMVKLYEVQVSSYEYYSTKSDSNRIKIRPVPAARGKIFDRNGKVIAKNISTFDLIVKKELIKNKEEFLEKASRIIKLDSNQKKKYYKPI